MWKNYLAGFAISLGAIYIFAKVVDLNQMMQALGEMNPWYLLPCSLLYLVCYAIRALRWHFLMRPVARVGFRPLFAALMIGFLGNNLLPAHLGEFVRAYVLGKTEGVSKSATFATIVLERVYDGLTVLMFLLWALLFLDLPEGDSATNIITLSSLRTAGWLGLAFFAGLMIFLQAFRWQRQRALKVCRFCLRPAPQRFSDPLLKMLDSFADGLAVARASDLGWVALLSIAAWLGLGLWAWTMFPAFGLDLGLTAGVLMEVVVALALLIPSAPAFLGTFHLAAVATLSFMGADSAVAGSYAMMLWLVHFVVTNVVGVYYMWRLGLGWSVLAGKGE